MTLDILSSNTVKARFGFHLWRVGGRVAIKWIPVEHWSKCNQLPIPPPRDLWTLCQNLKLKLIYNCSSPTLSTPTHGSSLLLSDISNPLLPPAHVSLTIPHRLLTQSNFYSCHLLFLLHYYFNLSSPNVCLFSYNTYLLIQPLLPTNSHSVTHSCNLSLTHTPHSLAPLTPLTSQDLPWLLIKTILSPPAQLWWLLLTLLKCEEPTHLHHSKRPFLFWLLVLYCRLSSPTKLPVHLL